MPLYSADRSSGTIAVAGVREAPQVKKTGFNRLLGALDMLLIRCGVTSAELLAHGDVRLLPVDSVPKKGILTQLTLTGALDTRFR